jgi:hypothetical protein
MRREVDGQQKRSDQNKVDWKAPDFIHPETAGIDVGRSEHVVAVRPDRDLEPSGAFRVFYRNLRPMGRWLINRGVRSVALQSTGVHWMTVLSLDDDAIETVVYPTPAGCRAACRRFHPSCLVDHRTGDRWKSSTARAELKNVGSVRANSERSSFNAPAFKTSSIGYLYLYVI